MWKQAVKSLVNDKVRSFFCWLTFTLTSMFIFLFFTIAMSDSIGVTMFYAKSDVPSILMIASIILCSVEIVFANRFFIHNKAKELAVRLVCGATYTQLASFLLFQTIILLILAFPVGICGSLLLLPAINAFFAPYLDSAIQVSFSSMIWTVIVLAYVVMWTLILNLSFSYRNSAAQLMKPNAEEKPQLQFAVFNYLVPSAGRLLFRLLLWLIPMIMFYMQGDMMVIWAVVSLVGFHSLLKHHLFPLINKTIEKKIDQQNSIIYLGFFRDDLKKIESNIVLYLVCSIILLSMFISTEVATYNLLIMVTYIAMNFLLSFAIFFKFADQISSRAKMFKTLSHIGYQKEDIRKIRKKEVLYFYGFSTVIHEVYLINMLVSMLLHGNIQGSNVLLLVLVSLVPMVLCTVITMLFYERKG